MSCTVLPFEEKYLEDASRLVAPQVQSLHSQASCLPARYADPGVLLPILKEITYANPGVVALQDKRLVGFMSAWRLDSFQGEPAVFSPELANAALLEDRQRIYEAMYASLATTWVADGYRTHLVSLLANDPTGLDAWNWLGFGLVAADAIRDLEPIPELPSACEIRRAGAADAETILSLDNALDSYLASSPTFLRRASVHTPAEVLGWIEDPHNAFWIASEKGIPLGFIGFGPASHAASQIIVDDRTTSISAAYMIESARSQGIATALLNRSLEWARTQGYTRCAVDFEPMNPLALRFWLRYFQPVSYSLYRRLF